MYLGIVVTSLLLGLRHGIDWDHVAAIADLTSSAPNRRRGFRLSMIYALGHAAIVFVLGSLALLVGTTIPAGVDAWMTRIVGATLIGLGLWILVELVRKGRNFTLRSRWMLIIDGTFAGLRRVQAGLGSRQISVEHEHDHQHADDSHDTVQAHDHPHTSAPVRALINAGALPISAPHSNSHAHTHRHDLGVPTDATAGYGGRAAAGIGMLHGVGIESPTQIAIFVTSTAVAGAGFGLVLLGAWVAGLIVANAILAVFAGAGLLNAERSFPIYAALAVVVAASSIIMGGLYVGGFDVLPQLS